MNLQAIADRAAAEWWCDFKRPTPAPQKVIISCGGRVLIEGLEYKFTDGVVSFSSRSFVGKTVRITYSLSRRPQGRWPKYPMAFGALHIPSAMKTRQWRDI